MKQFKILSCLIFFVLLSACGSKVELMSGVPEDEANEIMSTLLNDGISVGKSVGKAGVSLSVQSDQVSRALDVMRAHGLPRERFTGMGNIFQKQGLVSSALEERARYVYALSQELGGTLSQIDGVVSARVHVVLPDRGNINDAPTPATASVFLKHKPGVSLDVLMPQIRKLVANGIPGLLPEHVSIFAVAAQDPPPVVATPFENVMGFTVASASARALWITIGAFGVLFCGAASGFAYLGWLTWGDALAAKMGRTAARVGPGSGAGASTASKSGPGREPAFDRAERAVNGASSGATSGSDNEDGAR